MEFKSLVTGPHCAGFHFPISNALIFIKFAGKRKAFLMQNRQLLIYEMFRRYLRSLFLGRRLHVFNHVILMIAEKVEVLKN